MQAAERPRISDVRALHIEAVNFRFDFQRGFGDNVATLS